MNTNKGLFTIVAIIMALAIVIAVMVEPEPETNNVVYLWNYDLPPENEPVLCAWPRQGTNGRDYYEVVRAGDAYYALMDSGEITLCIERSRPIAWADLPKGIK